MKQTLLRHLFCCLLLLHGGWCARGQSAPQVPLGSAARYGLLSATRLITPASATAAPVQVLGQAGASQDIGPLLAATAGRFAQGSGTVPQALADLQRAQNHCLDLSQRAATQLSGSLASRSLGGGVYTCPGNADLGSGGTLTLVGDTGTVVIINVAGDLTLHANSHLALSGVRPQHLFWNVGGSLRVANGAAFAGVALLAGPATLEGSWFGAGAILSQQAISLLGSSALVGSNKFYAPLRPTFNCSPTNSCSFNRPGSELVRDGSFELARCCPTISGGLEAWSGGAYPYTSDACFWRNVTIGTPDYFHDCNTSTTPGHYVGVPVNFASNSQQVPALAQNSRALTGHAYAGGIMYGIAAPHQVYAEGSTGEEISQELTGVTLQPGRRYYGEFSAYLAQLSRYSVPQLGMGFITNNLPVPLSTVASITPVISGDPNLPIPAGAPAGTLVPRGWKRVGNIFTVATGLGQPGQPTPKLIIGNFNGLAHNDNGGGPGEDDGVQTHFDYAYYFIDNVSLSPLTEAGPSQELTLTCDGAVAPAVTLGTEPMPALVEATYQWTASPADPSLTAAAAQTANPTVYPTQTTTYSLAVTINGTTYPASSATITLPNATYRQNPPATYVGTGKGPAHELGMGGASTLTTIDAGQAPYGAATGNTVVFDGVYHVQGKRPPATRWCSMGCTTCRATCCSRAARLS